MAEITYAGYVPTSRPDYSALSNDLAEKIYGQINKRQERREKLDEVEQANQKLLDSWIPGKTQTLNDFMLKGVDNMRKDLLQWNKDLKAGKMSESEYVRRNRNLEESYQMLANVLKSQDERINTIMQRQEPDENGNIPASSYETDYLLKKFGEFTEGIKDKQIKTGSDGRIYLAKIDPNTGLVTDQVMDVRSMALPENLAANKVDVTSRVDEITKNWQANTFWEDLGMKGERNIETVKGRPEYKMAKERAVNSIAPDSNPRAQVSVLVDNGALSDVDYYDTDEEKNQILQEKVSQLMQIKKEAGYKGQAIFPTEQEMKEIEMNLIKNVLNSDGVYTPELTKEQQDLAKDLIRNEIDLSFGDKVTGTPLQVPIGRGPSGPSGPSGPGRQPSEEKPITKYRQIANAWETGNFNLLSANLNDKKYIVGPNKDNKGKKIPGYALYNYYDTDYENPIPKTGSNGIDNFWLIKFFGSSPTQQAEGERQQRIWRQGRYGGNAAPTKSNKPTNAGTAPRP